MSGHLSDRQMGEENPRTRELIPNIKTHGAAQQLWGTQIASRSVKSLVLGKQKGECGKISGLEETRPEIFRAQNMDILGCH